MGFASSLDPLKTIIQHLVKSLYSSGQLSYNPSMRTAQLAPKIICDEVPCPALGSPCHVPRKYHQPNGYVLVGFSNRQVLVHRYVLEQAYGPIPKGLVSDHMCMNKACCNLQHLRIVTRSVNALENTKRDRTHCPNGHPKTPENYIRRSAKGRPMVSHCVACERAARARYEAKRANKQASTTAQASDIHVR